jgi:site-specific DNA-methyltransferase (adenine-specific)
MDLMQRYPDNFFDLAVCDPPYGIGEDWKKRPHYNLLAFPDSSYKNDKIPFPHYFDELFRVCKDVIIFGYNYFTHILGPTNYLLIWNKCSNENSSLSYSQAEIAYTTIRKPIQVISVSWDGYRMGKETGIKKIHPHQKPVELYTKILLKYAKPGFKILDTHLGSGSSVIACHRLSFDVWASEIDTYYFLAAKKRIELEVRQQELYPLSECIPSSLFDSLLQEPCA